MATHTLPQPRPDFIAMYAKTLKQADQFARSHVQTPAVYYRQATVEFARRRLTA